MRALQVVGGVSAGDWLRRPARRLPAMRALQGVTVATARTAVA